MTCKTLVLKIPINFDDVGIPGFKGIREEKIEKIVPFISAYQ